MHIHIIQCTIVYSLHIIYTVYIYIYIIFSTHIVYVCVSIIMTQIHLALLALRSHPFHASGPWTMAQPPTWSERLKACKILDRKSRGTATPGSGFVMLASGKAPVAPCHAILSCDSPRLTIVVFGWRRGLCASGILLKIWRIPGH